jgi:hypothetical protein
MLRRRFIGGDIDAAKVVGGLKRLAATPRNYQATQR